jgi:hypothetical protein
MVTNPQEQAIIPVSPRSASGLGEEDPGLGARPVVHHYSMQPIFGMGVVVFLPDGRLEPLPACIADGYVGEEIVVVVGDQGGGEELPEGVVGYCAEDVVAESAAPAVGGPCRVVEKGREVLETALKSG